MKYLFRIFLFAIFFNSSIAWAAQGKVTGAEAYTIPDWFKLSFLEIQEDIREASEANKHVMLFMHLDGCPYCKRTLDENFRSGKTREYIQKHFDVIALNILGDREIQWDQNTTYTEKSLARAMKVIGTPTVVFLDAKGNKVYQMNGYRKPDAFRDILQYVSEKQYTKMKLTDYIAKLNKSRYQFLSHPDFIAVTDFSRIRGPVAIIFEDKACADCNDFHKEVLGRKDVMEEMKKLKVVRLDAQSTESIIDFQGKKTTPRDWARTLKLDYRPGTIVFDNGEERIRADGRLYHFHYREMLRYVSGGHYKQYPRFFAYVADRQRELLDAGTNVDYGK